MQRFLFICLAFIIMMVAVPGSPKNVSAEELIDQIIASVNDNKLDEALALTDRYIKKYPDEPVGYAVKGNILSDLYRSEEALVSYVKALDHLESERDKSLLYDRIGLTHYYLNQFGEALEYFDKVSGDDSVIAAGNSLRKAMVLLVLGRTQEARKQYERARPVVGNADKLITSDSRDDIARLYATAAWVAFQLDRKEDALEFANAALGISRDEGAPVLLATYLAGFGNTKEAAGTFQGADLKNVSSLQVASYYAVMGNTEEAKKYFVRSYKEQGSRMQLSNWRRELARDRMYPRDVWKNVRELEWFKSRAEGK